MTRFWGEGLGFKGGLGFIGFRMGVSVWTRFGVQASDTLKAWLDHC